MCNYNYILIQYLLLPPTTTKLLPPPLLLPLSMCVACWVLLNVVYLTWIGKKELFLWDTAMMLHRSKQQWETVRKQQRLRQRLMLCLYVQANCIHILWHTKFPIEDVVWFLLWCGVAVCVCVCFFRKNYLCAVFHFCKTFTTSKCKLKVSAESVLQYSIEQRSA